MIGMIVGTVDSERIGDGDAKSVRHVFHIRIVQCLPLSRVITGNVVYLQSPAYQLRPSEVARAIQLWRAK